jgi:endonuclease
LYGWSHPPFGGKDGRWQRRIAQTRKIDDAIRERRVRVRHLPEALGVSPERVYERWEWFRQEVYRRIADGKSTPEIVAEVGLPTPTIAAFRAQFSRGHGPEDIVDSDADVGETPGSDEVEDAVVTTFGLERDLQRTLRDKDNITQLEPGLQIIDGGREHRCATGMIDILCRDRDGALVVVELKAGLARDAALGQMLGYIGAIMREMTTAGEYAGRAVQGIMVAKEFSDRVCHASVAVPNLRLVSYLIEFTFEDRGLA